MSGTAKRRPTWAKHQRHICERCGQGYLLVDGCMAAAMSAPSSGREWQLVCAPCSDGRYWVDILPGEGSALSVLGTEDEVARTARHISAKRWFDADAFMATVRRLNGLLPPAAQADEELLWWSFVVRSEPVFDRAAVTS